MFHVEHESGSEQRAFGRHPISSGIAIWALDNLTQHLDDRRALRAKIEAQPKLGQAGHRPSTTGAGRLADHEPATHPEQGSRTFRRNGWWSEASSGHGVSAPPSVPSTDHLGPPLLFAGISQSHRRDGPLEERSEERRVGKECRL